MRCLSGRKGEEDDSDAVMDWIQDLHAPSDAGETPQKPNPEVIQRFFRRCWFTRVWVLQEIKVARAAKVICGEKSVVWDAFEQAPISLPHTASSLVSRGLFTGHIWQPPYPVRLLRLLQLTRGFGATDARDKLFAILPLLEQDTQQYLSISSSNSFDISGSSDNVAAHRAPDFMHRLKPIWALPAVTSSMDTSTHSLPRPPSASIDDNQPTFPIIRADYSRSTSETFAQLSRNLIDVIGLDILRTVVTPTTISNLPSWATDWATNWSLPEVHRFHRISGLGRVKHIYVDSLRDCTLPVTWCFSDYIRSDGSKSTQLEVSGNVAGTILNLGQLCNIHEDTFPLEQWESLCDPMQRTKMFMLGRWSDRHVATILGEIRRFNSEHLSENIDVLGARYASKYDKRDQGTQRRVRGRKLTDILNYVQHSLRHIATELFSKCHGRKFFIAETGLLGFAPTSARIGDQVLEMDGCTTPFVVRPVENQPKSFQLVGGCSSHGSLYAATKCEQIIIRLPDSK